MTSCSLFDSEPADDWEQLDCSVSSSPVQLDYSINSSPEVIPIPDDSTENAKIWNHANRDPTPTYVITSSSSRGAPIATSSVFTPSLTILRRPVASSSSSGEPAKPIHQKSFDDRAREYDQARTRIFGQEDTEDSFFPESSHVTPNGPLTKGIKGTTNKKRAYQSTVVQSSQQIRGPPPDTEQKGFNTGGFRGKGTGSFPRPQAQTVRSSYHD